MNTVTLALLAKAEMTKHGLREWKFELTNRIRALGMCDYKRQTISVQRTYAAREERPEVWDTVLHEIAHALTRGAKHGPVWQAKCRELGCRPEAKCKYPVEQRPRKAYVAICKVCEFTTGLNPVTGGTHWLKGKPKRVGKKWDGKGIVCRPHQVPLTFVKVVLKGKR